MLYKYKDLAIGLLLILTCAEFTKNQNPSLENDELILTEIIGGSQEPQLNYLFHNMQIAGRHMRVGTNLKCTPTCSFPWYQLTRWFSRTTTLLFVSPYADCGVGMRVSTDLKCMQTCSFPWYQVTSCMTASYREGKPKLLLSPS